MAKYAFQGMKENMARAMARDLEISTKTSIEMASFLKGKTTEDAKKILGKVLKKTQAIPFKRFTNGLGHKTGAMAAGRYPQKASEEFIALIEQVEANAQAKGLSSNLKITHLAAQKGANQWRGGRQRRRMFKRTSLEIVVEEMAAEKKTTKKTAAKTTEKKAAPKKTTKPKVEEKETEATQEAPEQPTEEAK